MVDKLPAGSIGLKTFKIKSKTGKALDIRALLVEFSIFDNIQKTFVTADFMLADAVSLITVFPIVGDETIEIEFNTPHPAFEKSIKLELRVIGIENLKRTNARSATYVLKCVSPEYIRNMTTKVRKSYGDQPISSMIKKLYEEYLKTNQDLNLNDESNGIRTITVPQMSPVEAIRFLSREAKSNKYPASNYMFFQSFEGFNLMTIEEMIKKNDTKGNDKYWTTEFGFYDDASSPRDVAVATGHGGGASRQSRKPFEFTKVMHFSFPQSFQYDKTPRLGALESTMKLVDPVMSLYTEKKYDYFKDFDKFERTTTDHAHPHFFLPPDTDLIATGDTKVMYRLTNETQEGNNYGNDQKSDFIQYRNASMAMLENVVVNVTIPGDSDRRAGDTINLEFPQYGGTDDVKGQLNKFLSGEYLVTATRHIYTAEGYRTAMLCCKNAFENATFNEKQADL